MMRKPTLDKLLTEKDSDIKEFVDSTLDPQLQKTIEDYLTALKSKPKAK
jgi:hypothetical protein